MSAFKHQTLKTKLIACLLLVLLTDNLFYQQPLGCNLGLYAVVVFAMLCAFHKHIFQSYGSRFIGLCTATLILNLFASPKPITLGMIGLAFMTLIILQKRQELCSAVLWLQDITHFLKQAGWQWYRDFKASKRLAHHQARGKTNFSYAIIPVALSLVFTVLFSQANPIIARFLSGFDAQWLGRFLSVSRWSLWFLAGITVWILLRPRFPLAKQNPCKTPINWEHWLNAQTITLSLVLFNGLFAIQNSLDVIFLWNGKTLPNGLSFAEYAQAGAYPLLATSVLTAAYVLISFADHQQQLQTATTKKLVFVWLAQNVILLVSAIYRLLHYIEAYSLTYLRITALLGMLLTAVGLVLIIVRIHAGHSNRWLINANTLTIAITLYGVCFINMDPIIADYNVRHALEVTGTGTHVDLAYLRNLGPESLPALRWFQEKARYSPHKTSQAGLLIAELENQLLHGMSNWRAWTWRNQQLLTAVTKPLKAIPIGNSGWQY